MAPFSVNFSGAGSSDDGSIVDYQWDFGDGSPPAQGPASSTTHTYTEEGAFEATLTVTDDEGNTAVSRFRVFAQADANPESNDAPMMIQLPEVTIREGEQFDLFTMAIDPEITGGSYGTERSNYLTAVSVPHPLPYSPGG